MTIRVVLEMTVQEGAFETLSTFFEEYLSNVRGFAGAFGVTLYHDPNTRAFLIHENWLSHEHDQASFAFMEERGVMAALQGLMKGPREMTFYGRMVI